MQAFLHTALDTIAHHAIPYFFTNTKTDARALLSRRCHEHHHQTRAIRLAFAVHVAEVPIAFEGIFSVQSQRLPLRISATDNAKSALYGRIGRFPGLGGKILSTFAATVADNFAS